MQGAPQGTAWYRFILLPSSVDIEVTGRVIEGDLERESVVLYFAGKDSEFKRTYCLAVDGVGRYWVGEYADNARRGAQRRDSARAIGDEPAWNPDSEPFRAVLRQRESSRQSRVARAGQRV